jgi:hypothetical protein
MDGSHLVADVVTIGVWWFYFQSESDFSVVFEYFNRADNATPSAFKIGFAFIWGYRNGIPSGLMDLF